jgi:hypothetical protein
LGLRKAYGVRLTAGFVMWSRAIDPQETGLPFSQHHTARALLTPTKIAS